MVVRSTIFILIITVSLVVGVVIGAVGVFLYEKSFEYDISVEQLQENPVEMPTSEKESDLDIEHDSDHTLLHTPCDKIVRLGYNVRKKGGYVLPGEKGTYDFEHYNCTVNEEKRKAVWNVRYSDSLGRSGIFPIYLDTNNSEYYILVNGEKIPIVPWYVKR